MRGDTRPDLGVYRSHTAHDMLQLLHSTTNQLEALRVYLRIPITVGFVPKTVPYLKLIIVGGPRGRIPVQRLLFCLQIFSAKAHELRVACPLVLEQN